MTKFPRRAGSLLMAFALLFFIVLLNLESLGYFIVKNVVVIYAGRAGLELEIGAIGGKLFSETTLDNVSTSPEKGAPQSYNFKARQITCRYDLWALREGVESFVLGLECSVQDPVFIYDSRGATYLEQTSDSSAQLSLPAVLPAVQVQNGTVIIRSTDGDTELRGIKATLSSGGAEHGLLVAASNFRFRQNDITKIETEFTARLRYAEAQLTIDYLDLGAQEIRATGLIDLGHKDQGIKDFAADLVFAESRATLTGSVAKQLLKAQLHTDSFDIGELQKRLGGSGWGLAGKIRGGAELAYNLQSGEDLDGSFNLTVEDGRLHGVAIKTVAVAGTITRETLVIARAGVETPGNRCSLSNLVVPLSLVLGGELPAIIAGSEAGFEGELTDLEAVARLLALEGGGFSKAALPDRLSFRGKLANGVFSLDEARAVAADSSLTISQGEIPVPATAAAFESGPISLVAKLDIANLSELGQRFGEIALQGRVSVDMAITGSVKAPRGMIRLTGDNLGVREVALGSIALRGEVGLRQDKLGRLDAAQLQISELSQENNSGTLDLLAPISGVWQASGFSISGGVQVDGTGELAISVAGSPGSELTAQISAGNLDSGGWLGNFVDSRFFFRGADLEAVFTESPQGPQLRLAGTVAKAGAAEVPFPLAGKFGLHYSSGGIEISEFIWESPARNRLSLTGHLPYDPLAAEPYLGGELSLKGHGDIPALEDLAVFLEPWGIAKGGVDLDLDLHGSWDEPLGHLRLKAESLEPPAALKQHLDSPMNLSCDLDAQVGAIVLQAASLESAAYTARATGTWHYGIALKELLQRRRPALSGEVVADATVQLQDLNFLRKKLPWLRRLEGDMQAEIHIEGPVTGPAMTGSFSLRDGEASHVFNFPMLAAVNLQGAFDEHSVTIKNMGAELGGSPLQLRGSISRGQEAVALNLHVEGENVLLFRNNDMRMRGDVRLDVSGPLDHLLIKGTTGLSSGYYSRNIDFLGKIGSADAPVSEGVSLLFSFPEPPLKDAVFDIKITTIEPFRIRNNLIRGGLRPDLSLKGTGELPYLVGTIYIDPSRILLPSGRLQIQSGLLRFLEAEPDRPQLDLLAQSTLLGYAISVGITGPVADPVITLTSSPALPNDELLLLLLTGQPPKQEASVGGIRGRGTTNVMVYLGRDFLNRWLEDESGQSDETILDRFELDFGRSVTRSGDQTVESSFRLSDQVTRTGKVFYLAGEKDKFDAYNYGLKLVFRLD